MVLVGTDVAEEHIASIIRVEGISELGTFPSSKLNFPPQTTSEVPTINCNKHRKGPPKYAKRERERPSIQLIISSSSLLQYNTRRIPRTLR
jgi:hypothetical protein